MYLKKKIDSLYQNYSKKLNELIVFPTIKNI